MIDTVQVVLLFVIVLLTVLLVILGIQIFFILKEVRGAIKRVNGVIDHADEIAQNFAQPMNMLGGIFANGGSVASILQVIKMFAKKDKKE